MATGQACAAGVPETGAGEGEGTGRCKGCGEQQGSGSGPHAALRGYKDAASRKFRVAFGSPHLLCTATGLGIIILMPHV